MSNAKPEGIISSSTWAMVATLIDRASVLIVYVMLARYINREDFGYIALSLLVVDYATFLAGMGIREKLVTQRKWNQALADNAFWLLLVLSSVLGLIIYGAALLSFAPNTNSSARVIEAICLLPLMNSLNIVQLAKLQREFQFKSLATRSVIAASISSIVAILMVLNEFGVWSFVGYKYSYAICNTVILWTICRYIPRPQVHFHTLKSYLAYGLPIVGAGLIYLTNRRLLENLTAPFLGITKLGDLDIGKKLPETFYQVTLSSLKSVGLSFFSKSKNKHQAFSDYTTLISLFTIPIILSVGFLAEEIIFILFGEDKVSGSALILQITSLGVFASTYNWLSQSYLLALSKQKNNFYITLIELVFVFLCCIFFIDQGIETLVAVYILTTSVFIVVKFIYFHRKFGFDIKYFFDCQKYIVFAAILLSFTYIGLDVILKDDQKTDMDIYSAVRTIITYGFVSTLVYISIIIVFFKKKLKLIISQLKDITQDKQ